jgi:hypothetical protein
VLPETFLDSFGFRGVQFGNWVEGLRRQIDLNEAHDALMDMAVVLALPPRYMGLNGSLGLAFGARGSGGTEKAKAHYEPDEVVINLTKKSGPGSLAHEWFHALDNYYARLEQIEGMEPVLVAGYATEAEALLPSQSISEEIVAAFRAIGKAVNSGDYALRSAQLDKARSKPYFSRTTEKAARAFEKYLISRLAAKGITNDYLVNLVKEESPALPTDLEMGQGIVAAFDKLFATLEHVRNREASDAPSSDLLQQGVVREAEPF